MSLFQAQVFPGQALGILMLGASLHDILNRLKAEPQIFPKIDLHYDQISPLTEPVILGLPANGIRLRFDGSQQRLRLIEVLDFTKCHLSYKDRDILRPITSNQSGSTMSETQFGPSFRHIYNRVFGPTFPGEYLGPAQDDKTEMGTYVLSYPGIAFLFPLAKSFWSPDKDCVSLLSSSNNQIASSMAIFRGASWPDARNVLYKRAFDPREHFSTHPKGREPIPNEVKLLRIHGEGYIELLRLNDETSFWIKLGLTTPQELVANLGPPDAIYRKNDQKLSIHKPLVASISRSESNDSRFIDESTDTDQSSAYTATDSSGSEGSSGGTVSNVSSEFFYNYFHHGFDVLLSSSVVSSVSPPPSVSTVPRSCRENVIPLDASNRIVATKLVLHGNIPGSYAFNRHRRCRWEIQYLNTDQGQKIVNSESPFSYIEKRLHNEWQSIYKNTEETKFHQRGMVLNRDWGDSPGSSYELLGGWEEDIESSRADVASVDGTSGLGNTTLFGFPGLVFEVLKSGAVSGVTVF
ncbi:hypothetical protein K3495_g3792 [Podosphaera aphanis]|nr:hypothetical protein K3495_g3792 [Podosphaera aphanis]